MKNRKKYILFGIMGLMILFGGILLEKSYAIFETDTISKSAVTINVGTMNPILGLDLYVKAGESDTFVVTLENGEDVSGKFLLYYKGVLPSGVTFGYLEEEGMDVPLKDGVVIAKGEKRMYSLYVNNQSSVGISIDLEAIGGLFTQPITLPSGGNYIEKTTKPIVYPNKFMSKVYQYDQTTDSSTFCVTEEESTCVQIEAPATYSVGTIIKYKVNNTEEKYFHVVSDNGDTLTLQQRENLVYDTAWYADDLDNTKGPTTILPAIENATMGWTNIMDHTYTLGTTTFKDNAFTGCSCDSTNKVFNCTTNTYTLGERIAKARLISVQEVHALGCTKDLQSCPVWMYNYLNNSTGYGGTVDQTGDIYGKNWGYWTMNAYSSNSSNVWYVSYHGIVITITTSNTRTSGRAVIVEK